MNEYEGVTHAGIAVVAADTGRVLLAQRAPDETDDPAVAGTWEFPGGAVREGEDPMVAATREFEEEIGFPLPEGEVVDGWRADENGTNPEGHYQGFVYVVPEEVVVEGWAPTTEVQAVGWFDAPALDAEEAHGRLRPEIKGADGADGVWSLIWGAVSGNTEEGMDAETIAEPDFEEVLLSVAPEPIPIHGVLAPEGVPSGDKRLIAEGGITRRPYRLPFSWQKISSDGHNGSVVVGGLDRLWRKDGAIHYQGYLMPSAETDEFLDLLTFFGRYGVSIDGDKVTLNREQTEREGLLWFDATRASGLTAVHIPAFAEAYVTLGVHPDLPEEGTEEYDVLTASGDIAVFKRGPGWVTHPKETKRIHDYWTKKGQPGYAKIGWGTPGDFTRAKALIGEKILKNSPSKARYLNQIAAQWHYDALGYWPGELGKPGNPPDTKENRQRAARHAGKRVKAAYEPVLTSSAGVRVLPPSEYFQRHPETGALTIEPPDENGIRRVHGYAAEWGVCHVGNDKRCVTPPEDPTGEYAEFHLGRIETADAGFIHTGVLTYNVSHRSAKQILSESATQQHYDNLKNAWAAVRIGNDDRGIWYSGVVLPGVPEDDLVKIQAAGQVSGEWKYGALRALLTVNVPGFPVLRSSAEFDEEGNVLALVACAHPGADLVEEPPCAEEDDPIGDLALAVVERLEAKREMERLRGEFAQAEFARLKDEWKDLL